MREKKLSRRDFLRVSALTAAGAALAACAPATPAPTEKPAEPAEEQPPEPVEEAPAEEGVLINYWAIWSQYVRPWEGIQALDEYKELIGNNQIELKTGFDAETLLTAVAGGEPPDAVSHPAGQYLDYMARGVLLPIEDLVATSSIIKEADFLEGSWSNGFYQGTQYGVPANEGFLRYGLNYNAKLVEEAGLDPDNPPETWSECMEWHEALTKFDDAGNLQQVGLDPYDAMGGSLQFDNGFYAALSWGFNWFDEEAGTFNLNNDMMAESFDVEGEFYRFAGPDNMAGMRQVEGQGTWGGSFNTEVQAMLIEGYWHPGETSSEKPEVAEHNRSSWPPVPDSRKGTKAQGYGGHYILLFKEAPNAEPAFKIAELMNTTPACDVMFQELGWLPALKPYLATVDQTTYPGLEFYFKSVDEATAWHTPARCPITGFVQTQYVELREAVYRDEMTGAEAAEEFQKRCEEEYKAAGFA
jgi:ABC-type glycerol-3-phosphate transport system substrate-binding protein